MLDRDVGGFLELLDHEIALSACHGALDLRVLVPRRDDEALRVAPHLLVGRARQLEALQAVEVAALADELDTERVSLA